MPYTEGLEMPRKYRVHVYDRDREALTDRSHVTILSLAGSGLAAAAVQLDTLLHSLARQNGARGEDVLGYHLLVRDWDTGEEIGHWSALTRPDTY